MSFASDMFWNVRVKNKKVDETKLKVTIPDFTALWTPTSEAQGVREETAPFLFRKVGGDWQVYMRVSGKFHAEKDQAGILIRQNNRGYFRVGVEVHSKPDIVTQEGKPPRDDLVAAVCLVDNDIQDWSCLPIEKQSKNEDYWFSIKRKGNILAAYFSRDGQTYQPLRVITMDYDEKVSVGAYGACPLGKSLKVAFQDFKIDESSPGLEEFERE